MTAASRLDRTFWPESVITPEMTVTGLNGMVLSEHPLASQAGLRILQAGGNAVDAAVAVAACLSVVAPYMISPGGIGYMLLYRAKTGGVESLDFAGPTPRAATLDTWDASLSWEGPRAALVPSALGGWLTALETRGSMSRELVFRAAIQLAEQGFPLAPKQAPYFRRLQATLARFPTAASVFLPGGRPPQSGQVLLQRDLGRTFRQIVEGGREVFYEGDIASAIVEGSRANGGLLEREDLAEYRCDWESPEQARYREYSVFTPRPPCSGSQILETLKLLETYDFEEWEPGSAAYLHHLVEAIKLAAADRVAYAYSPIAWEELLSSRYAARRRAAIDPRRAAASHGDRFIRKPLPGFVREGALALEERLHTTHFAVVDQEGNAVSTTQTLGTLFGSGYVAGDTGVLLNNKMYWTDLDPASPNALRPGKRAGMNIAPTLLTRDGRLVMTAGSPGSFGILQIVPQIILNVLEFGLRPQRAVEAPRVISLGLGNEAYLQALEPTCEGTLLALEERIPRQVAEELVGLGHDVRYVGQWANLMGCAGLIWRDSATGAYIAGADPRRDSQALCW